MRASLLLKRNIKALLLKRGEKARTLARYCGATESWLSKALREHDSRQIPVKHLDKIADFFGIEPYQLFAPGIDPLLERRVRKTDRRSGVDRRRSTEADRVPPKAEALVKRVLALDDRQRRAVASMLAMLEQGGGTGR